MDKCWSYSSTTINIDVNDCINILYSSVVIHIQEFYAIHVYLN